jgi:hypothetical protein
MRETGDPVRQYLLYGSMYAKDIAVPPATSSGVAAPKKKGAAPAPIKPK